MLPPVVFISYSHDSPEHKAWVKRLATDLRANGVDAVLDIWKLSPGQDIAAFMEKGIRDSERVILVCTESYNEKAEAGSGGVGYERLIVTRELVESIDTKKFIPVTRVTGAEKIPSFLGPRLYVDFSNDGEYEERLEALLREILGAPPSGEPPVGPNPFSGSPPSHGAGTRVVGITGTTQRGESVLDDAWFAKQHSDAIVSAGRLGIQGHMEIRLALHENLSKSQIELLNAVRASEVHTFGWPIGVTLENRDEFRPQPVEYGVRAEVAIAERSMSGEKSYDSWAIRTNGDFFLLQSFFEDQRAKGKLFFNTRIVRVTETFLFAANLYENLGAPPESHLTLRITHRGLAGRQLTASSHNRHVFPSQTTANESTTQLTVQVKDIRDSLIENVQRITAPMFMLFEFKEFNRDIYKDIVERFVRGEVS